MKLYNLLLVSYCLILQLSAQTLDVDALKVLNSNKVGHKIESSDNWNRALIEILEESSEKNLTDDSIRFILRKYSIYDYNFILTEIESLPDSQSKLTKALKRNPNLEGILNNGNINKIGYYSSQSGSSSKQHILATENYLSVNDTISINIQQFIGYSKRRLKLRGKLLSGSIYYDVSNEEMRKTTVPSRQKVPLVNQAEEDFELIIDLTPPFESKVEVRFYDESGRLIAIYVQK